MASDDPVQTRYSEARAAIRSAMTDLTNAHRVLAELKPEVHNARGRGQLNRSIWECERALGHRDAFASQAGQDAFLDERVFRGKSGGVFVEIGGYDGVTGSNCLFFEMMRGWSGLIIEPSPVYHALCAARRRSECLQLAVGAATGTAEFLQITEGMKQMGGLLDSYDPRIRQEVEADPRHQGEVVEVAVRPLADILAERDLHQIDYISLDVEGAEMDVLRDFPFERFEITAWTIENNTAQREVPELMQARGYERVEALGVDDVYLRNPG